MSFSAIIKSNGFEVMLAVLLSNQIAQFSKTFYHSIINNKIDWSMLLSTGGMPSSHSSSVVALATSVGLITGYESIEFAIATAIAAIVMYDAAGVRRSAGKQAAVLNKIVKQMPGFANAEKIKLKELLGHSPKEIFAGALLGILISNGLHMILN